MAADLAELLPAVWRGFVSDRDPLDRVSEYLAVEAAAGRGFQPEPERVFRALQMTAPEQVSAVLIGQDPYPTPGVATGLAFDAGSRAKLPASLRNVLTEYSSDLGYPPPADGDLSPWTRQVLMLNAILTCRPGEASSHRGHGWEEFTGQLLAQLAREREGLVFLAWGKQAQRLVAQLPLADHSVVEAVHPSPLSAYGGWFGSRPFSRTNVALGELGQAPVDWRLA